MGKTGKMSYTGGLVGMVIVNVRVDNNTINTGYYIIIMIRIF